MYYRLNEQYELRGWELLPFALVERATGTVTFMRKDRFRILWRCDGLHEISREDLSGEERGFLDDFLEKRIVAEVSVPCGLSGGQKYIKYDSRFIRSAQWAITGKCNFRCRHCYLSAPEGKLGELPHDDCMRIVRELASCGIRQVTLTGGEPLIRQDFWEIVDELRGNGIVFTGIMTNGGLVTEDFLIRLEERGLRPAISISFDGVGWHDWLRGVPGAEKMAVDAFRRCQKRGFPTMAEMCVHRKNIDSFPETLRLLGECGVSALKVNGVEPVGEWAQSAEDLTLSLRELNDVYLEYIGRFYEAGMPLTLMLDSLFVGKKRSTDYVIPFWKPDTGRGCEREQLCGHARNFLFISPDGYTLPCAMLANTGICGDFPNLCRTSLREILSDSFYMRMLDLRMKEYLEHNPKCADCRYKVHCRSGCRGFAIGAEGRDYLAVDESACLRFQEGYYDRVRAAADAAIAGIGKTPADLAEDTGGVS